MGSPLPRLALGRGTSHGKVSLGNTPSSEDLEAHTLNSKAILDPPLKKL